MKREYSAGAVSKGFWFSEIKKYLKLLEEGKIEKEIRELQIMNNIFMAKSKDYGKKIFGEINKRVKEIPEEIVRVFFTLDVETQKIINLIAIMTTDKLIFEYIYSCYRNEIMLGTEVYLSETVKLFLEEKAKNNEEISKFSENTLERLRGTYTNYLKEAGLIEENKNKKYYKKIYIDYEIEKKYREIGMEKYIKALKGEY